MSILKIVTWTGLSAVILSISIWLSVWLPYYLLKQWQLLAYFHTSQELQLALQILSVGIYIVAGVIIMAISVQPTNSKLSNIRLAAIAITASLSQLLAFTLLEHKAYLPPPMLAAAIPFIGLWTGGRLSILVKQLTHPEEAA